MFFQPPKHVSQGRDQECTAATRGIKNAEVSDVIGRAPREYTVQDSVDQIIDNRRRRVVNASFVTLGLVGTERIGNAKLMKVAEKGNGNWVVPQ